MQFIASVVPWQQGSMRLGVRAEVRASSVKHFISSYECCEIKEVEKIKVQVVVSLIAPPTVKLAQNRDTIATWQPRSVLMS